MDLLFSSARGGLESGIDQRKERRKFLQSSSRKESLSLKIVNHNPRGEMRAVSDAIVRDRDHVILSPHSRRPRDRLKPTPPRRVGSLSSRVR